MWKLIVIVVLFVCAWAYYNKVDVKNINLNDMQKNAIQMKNDATNNVVNSVKNEKTIRKVNETRSETNQETQKASDN